MISNSNMAAIPIWRQFQYGDNSNMVAIPIWRQNNMAAIMECQIIPLNTIITWRIRI